MREQQRGGEEDDVIGQDGRGGEREGEGSLALIFFPFLLLCSSLLLLLRRARPDQRSLFWFHFFLS